MKSIGRVLRWAGAVIAGFIAYLVVFAIGYLMWRRYGGEPAGASRWILAIATCGAVLAGAFVAPPQYRRAAALALWGLALLFPVTLLLMNTLAGHFTSMNLFEFVGTVFGGLPAYYVVRIAPQRTPKAEG